MCLTKDESKNGKNHYKLERREKALLDYWNIEAKKGNKNAIDVLDFHTYLITRESRLVGICRRTTIISRLRYVEKFFEKPYRKTDETGMLEALKGIENATLKSNGKPRSPNTVKTDSNSFCSFNYISCDNKDKK